MSYGLEITNSSGKTQISERSISMHHSEKATVDSHSFSLADFPDYSGAYDSLTGCNIFEYSFDGAEDALPLLFIKPANYGEWHGMIREWYDGSNTWKAKVMVSGSNNSTAPDLHVFMPADYMTGTTDGYGLVVYRENGTTKSFDSRYAPLVITNASHEVDIKDPRSNAPTTTSGHDFGHATNDYDFSAVNTTTAHNSYTVSGLNTTNTMFSCPSVAQYICKRQMNGYRESCGALGIFCQDLNSSAMWWAMYRAGFKIRTNTFDAGLTCFAAGYHYSAVAEDGGWFGGGGGTWDSGTMPDWDMSFYGGGSSNQTTGFVNAEDDRGVLFADASRYS